MTAALVAADLDLAPDVGLDLTAEVTLDLDLAVALDRVAELDQLLVAELVEARSSSERSLARRSGPTPVASRISCDRVRPMP